MFGEHIALKRDLSAIRLWKGFAQDLFLTFPHVAFDWEKVGILNFAIEREIRKRILTSEKDIRTLNKDSTKDETYNGPNKRISFFSQTPIYFNEEFWLTRPLRKQAHWGNATDKRDWVI